MTFLKNPLLLIYLFIPVLVINFSVVGENHFVYLAYSFLNGNLSLIKISPLLTDLSYFDSKYFLPFGPFPAFLLMPFVLIFQTNFLEGLIKIPLTILNFWLILKISQKFNLDQTKSILIAIFFIFGSSYTPLSIIPFSSYLPQITATSALLIAIYEFLGKKRYSLIGVALAIAILSRPSVLPAIIFFIAFISQRPYVFSNLIKFSLPILLSISFLGFYNYARFKSVLESGYQYQIIYSQEAVNTRNYGLFSPKHIPANLYYMLIKTPNPVTTDNSQVLRFPYIKFDEYGTSIFFLSPILFLLFKTPLRKNLVKISFFTILLISIPIITYYGIGTKQIGYRYALDFFPFLLIPLIFAVKKTNIKLLVLLVCLGVFITWFLIIELMIVFNQSLPPVPKGFLLQPL